MSGAADLEFWLMQQLKAFEENFDIVDKDGNGSLQFSEICEVLRNSGFSGTDDDVKKLFQFADTNKDNKVSRNEYMTAVKKAPKVNLKQILLRRAFKRFDKDGSGFLSKAEIMEVASSKEVGLKVGDEKISDLLVTLCKKGGDNKVDYEEFLSVFLKGKA